MTDITKHTEWCLAEQDDKMMPCDCGTHDAEMRAEGAKREREKRPTAGYVTANNGIAVRQVLCPYCAESTPRHPHGQLHTFELHPDFHPDVEALHCDFASLPFDVLFHPDGTPEPIPQHDPRFEP